MKLTIPRSKLMAALAAVKSAARGGSVPILSNVLLVASDQAVTLTCTDLDVHLRIRTDATVATEGQTTVRAALLADILRLTDNDEVRIGLKKNLLAIECGSARHEIATLPAEDFPPFPSLPSASLPAKASTTAPIEITLEDSGFRAMLAETGYAASTDEQRYILCGSFIKLHAGRLQVVCCDGRRCAVSQAEIEEAGTAEFILPVKTVHELLRLLGSDAENPHRLTIRVGVNLAQFTSGDLTIVSKLIEGNYPDYTKIVPAEDVIAILPRAELLRSIGRIALVAEHVSLKFTKSALNLVSHGKHGNELLGQASDSLLIPANRTVESTFSARYLVETLSAITDDSVEFHLSANKVALFKPPGRDWRGVVAPLTKEKAAAKPVKEAVKAEPSAAVPEPIAPLPK